jgi:hypothetical protein
MEMPGGLGAAGAGSHLVVPSAHVLAAREQQQRLLALAAGGCRGGHVVYGCGSSRRATQTTPLTDAVAAAAAAEQTAGRERTQARRCGRRGHVDGQRSGVRPT